MGRPGARARLRPKPVRQDVRPLLKIIEKAKNAGPVRPKGKSDSHGP